MSARGSIAVRAAVGIYRSATRLLPRSFRTEYGAELADCFSRIAADGRQRGRFAVASVLLFSIFDLLVSAPRQHLAAARAGVLDPGGAWVGSCIDLRLALRRLARRPSFSLTAIATLGLGLGAATAVFTLVHGVLLRPLPYPEAEGIVAVDHGGKGIGIDRGLGVTHGVYRFYQERTGSLDALGMYGWTGQILTGAGEPVRLASVRATPSLGEVLGVAPRLGRWFTPDDVRPGAPRTIVLSHALWRERFGGDEGVVGRVVQLDEVPHEVVGVMPRDFTFPDREASLWTPLPVPETGLGGWNFKAVGRLAPGSDATAAERELTALLPKLREVSDDPARVEAYLDEAKVYPRVVGLQEEVVGDLRATLWVLLGAVGFVLVIAVANVANLFLVQAEERRRATAVRAALGAGGVRLLRGFLAESGVLALLAGSVGLSLAWIAVAALRATAPIQVPRLQEAHLDPTVVGACLGGCVAAALLLGPLALLAARGSAEAVGLREGASGAISVRRRVHGRSVLVGVQVALALVLLIAAGLMFRTFDHLRRSDLGFTERQALTFEVALPESRYASRARAGDFHDRLLGRLAALPGVEAAGAVGRCLPLTGHMCWGETLVAEGFPRPEGELPPVTGVRIATPGYFATLGIPVRGRVFRPGDESRAASPAILSEAAAAAYFHDADPIGRRISFRDEEPSWYTVVGVAADVRARVGSDDFLRTVYLPMRDETDDGPPATAMSYVLRTAVPPTSLVAAVRAAVGELDPLVPLAEVRSLRQVIGKALAPTTFTLALLAVAGSLALLLGMVGLYGAVAYGVSRRRAEIGVRLAVGASGPDIVRMILRQGGAVVLAGTAVGLAGALALSRLMESLLVGVSPTDPLSFSLLTALLLAVATGALWLPARRAARVSPSTALRSE